jgi:phosphatidylinositol glycan class S
MTTIATAAVTSDDDQTSLSKTVAEAARTKTPPQETPQHVRRRRLIILSLWAIVLAIGLPVWYHTTAVYRAVLPLQSMTDWAEGKVRQNVCSFNITPADHRPPLDMYPRLPSAH